MNIIAKTYMANKNLILYNPNTGNISAFNSEVIDILNDIDNIDEDGLLYLLRNNYIETDSCKIFKSKTLSLFDESVLILNLGGELDISKTIKRISDCIENTYISNVILHIPASAQGSQYKTLYDFCSTLTKKIKVVIYSYEMLTSNEWIWLRRIDDILLIYNDDFSPMECGFSIQSWNVTIDISVANKKVDDLIEIATTLDSFNANYYFNFLSTMRFFADLKTEDSNDINFLVQKVADAKDFSLKSALIKSIYKKPNGFCYLPNENIDSSNEISLINYRKCNDCEKNTTCSKCEVSDFCQYKCRASVSETCNLKTIILDLLG